MLFSFLLQPNMFPPSCQSLLISYAIPPHVISYMPYPQYDTIFCHTSISYHPHLTLYHPPSQHTPTSSPFTPHPNILPPNHNILSSYYMWMYVPIPNSLLTHSYFWPSHTTFNILHPPVSPHLLHVHVPPPTHPTPQCCTPISTLSCNTLSPTLSHHNLYHSALQPFAL